MKKKSLGFCLLFCLALPCLAGCGNRFSKELDRLLGDSKQDDTTNVAAGETVTVRGRISLPPSLSAPSVRGAASVGGIVVRLLDVNRTATTENDGSFVFNGVPAGNHNLLVAYSNEYKAYKTIVVGGNGTQNVGDILLKETGLIAGNVTLPGKENHSGIEIMIPGMSLIAKSSTAGDYVILYVPEGTYTLQFSKDKYDTLSVPDVLVIGKQATIVPNQILQVSQGTEYVYTVANDKQWHSTAIELEPLQRYKVTASGSVETRYDGTVGPDGGTAGCFGSFTGASGPVGALLGKIGNSTFVLGDYYEGTATEAGILELGIHCTSTENSDGYTVKINVF